MNMNTNTGCPAPSLLTAHNKRNRARGYELYLPGDSIEQHRQYWWNNYGVDIKAGQTGQTMVMVEMEMEYGTRMFPLSVLSL